MNKVVNLQGYKKENEWMDDSWVLQWKINDITNITWWWIIKWLELADFTLWIIDILKSRLPWNTPAEMISNNAKIRQIIDNGQADDYNQENTA